ncbi:DUF5309 domain-containing protein [Natranaerobius thermophilus]|uniref:Phage major capsid protein n=1 Tax=Natranaerobius thermophilus (strain ATCC BAA-1301 / DSM 18059 / JW/NM-WN-LF) TaxID=457570 RepID=B2A213_NATTJ|nr:DUF5309 domain-containing protein [Natranaerobius thermophilus]ACB84818.1 conserved hypothetical protein [Natranaerobius thermophilus JW/NM-WN-LF]
MFTHNNFLQYESIDMSGVLEVTNVPQTPITSLLMVRQVQAQAPQVHWVEVEIDESSAVTQGEGDDAPEHKTDNRELKENYLEIFGATAKVSNTAQYSTSETVNDLLAHEVELKTQSIRNRMENKFINGNKNFADGVYETDGILNLINSENQKTEDEFNENVFLDTLQKLYDANVHDNMIVFLRPEEKIKINQEFNNVVKYTDTLDRVAGFDAEQYISPFGIVRFALAPKLPANTMFVINPAYLEMPTLIPFTARPQNPSGSKQEVYLETQAGVKLLNSYAGSTLEISTA